MSEISRNVIFLESKNNYARNIAGGGHWVRGGWGGVWGGDVREAVLRGVDPPQTTTTVWGGLTPPSPEGPKKTLKAIAYYGG
jgi:hypothetical protein